MIEELLTQFTEEGWTVTINTFHEGGKLHFKAQAAHVFKMNDMVAKGPDLKSTLLTLGQHIHNKKELPNWVSRELYVNQVIYAPFVVPESMAPENVKEVCNKKLNELSALLEENGFIAGDIIESELREVEN